MTHEEFELAALADPSRLSTEHQAHAAQCPRCAALQAELLRLDQRLKSALSVEVPAQPITLPVERRFGWPQGLAAAAALVGAIGVALFAALPREALAHSVTLHVDHEPLAFSDAAPVDATRLAEVLDAAHLKLLPGSAGVTYAQSCPFRGHVVPHLAVQTARGPVVVMVLEDERVSARQSFSERGYHGVIVPAERGSLAIVSAQDADLDSVLATLKARLRYLD